MRPTVALLLLVSAFLVLGAVYAAKTPYREPGFLRHQGGAPAADIGAPDERQHANYIRHVIDGEGFPVLVPGSADLYETYQAHQPPLYYLLAAGWAKLAGSDPTDPASGGRIRYLNLLIGIGTLFGIYKAAVWGLGREDVGLAAVAVAGLMPMFVALHAAVGNDPLLFLLCTWCVALAGRGIRHGWDWRTSLLCGVLAGLGLLTKTTALALLPMLLFALAVSAKRSEKRPPLASWAMALVLPVMIGMPWMVRNQKLYGDPFAITAFNAAFVGSPQPHHVAIPSMVNDGDEAYVAAFEEVVNAEPDLPPRQLLDRVHDKVGMTGGAQFVYWTDWVGWWTARSFVGVFGYMDVFILDSAGETGSGTFYRVVLGLMAVCAVFWLLSLRGADATTRAIHATYGVFLVVIALLFVRFNLQYFQGQARYLYPAIAPIAVGLGLGLCQALGRHKEWGWAVAAVALSVVQVFVLSALTAGFGPR
jgi:4-amino-4-deoxy-L-arabinose transferase-like glycosyltransferase